LRVALSNPNGRRRRYELIAVAAPDDRNLATTKSLTHRAVRGNAAYLVAIDDKIVKLVSLRSRQAVLFDQLLDLRPTRLFVCLVLLPAAQLPIAGAFGELRLLCGEFRLGGDVALAFR